MWLIRQRAKVQYVRAIVRRQKGWLGLLLHVGAGRSTRHECFSPHMAKFIIHY
jgi:hypothetical protein